jgi:hypothetical protein
MSTANESDVLLHLLRARMLALTDRGFSRQLHQGYGVAAFPKANQVLNFQPTEMHSLSAVRTSGCEWPYGQLKTLFPLLVQKWKNKLYSSAPEQVLVTAMILSNCIRILKGCNNNIFFDLRPFLDIEEYFNF